MVSRKQKYGYGDTDIPQLQYVGKKSPPGVTKEGYKLFFTKGGNFCIKKGKSKVSPCRWGGNRAGRRSIRKGFLENPKSYWEWINK